jgi:hypothetical protein
MQKNCNYLYHKFLLHNILILVLIFKYCKKSITNVLIRFDSHKCDNILTYT